MIKYMGVILIITAVIIAVAVFGYLKRDIIKQDIAIEGQKCRKRYGSFSIEQCIQKADLVKGRDWLEQKNGGIAPQLYRRKIKYKNHFEDCRCLVVRKGL